MKTQTEKDDAHKPFSCCHDLVAVMTESINSVAPANSSICKITMTSSG